MACVMNCSICGTQTLNVSICGDCKDEMAYRAMNGMSTDIKEVRKVVVDKRDEEFDKRRLDMLKAIEEEDGRNSWRTYQRQRDECRDVIDKAVHMIEAYGEDIPEMQSLKKVLESIDTGRKTREKFEKAKSILRSIIKK